MRQARLSLLICLGFFPKGYSGTSLLLGSDVGIASRLLVFCAAFRLNFSLQCLEGLALGMCDQGEVVSCPRIAVLVSSPDIPNIFPRIDSGRFHNQSSYIRY